MATRSRLAAAVEESFAARNAVGRRFADAEAHRIAAAARDLAERFTQGGRLLAFGAGAYATDAQHVSVEFVHPVIVGKRALPALDVSQHGAWLTTLLRPVDAVMGFGPPDLDSGTAGPPPSLRLRRTRPRASTDLPPQAAEAALDAARRTGALTFGLTCAGASYVFSPENDDPLVHQEVVEILYHTLWESVHVFLEHQPLRQDAGDASFLYPFLGDKRSGDRDLIAHVSRSIREKFADTARLRDLVARDGADAIAEAAALIRARLDRGGKLILFGNGGSATDASDWAFDCACPPDGCPPRPAISLSLEPAVLTALANDVGPDVIFLRQLLAHAEPGDVAVAISTSGGSANVVAALDAARRRGLATVALLGRDGGDVTRRGLAEVPIVVPSDYVPRIQEVQASIYHVIRQVMEDACLAAT